MQQEPADKLHRADGNRLGAIFLSIFRAKRDHAVLKGLDTAVGDRHAVGVAGQVVQDLLRVFNRIAHTDHPVFGKQGVLQALIPLGFAFEFFTLAGAVQKLHELAAKDQRERALIKQRFSRLFKRHIHIRFCGRGPHLNLSSNPAPFSHERDWGN